MTTPRAGTGEADAAAVLTIGAAIDQGIAEEMRRDERVIALGTQPPASLVAEFGRPRVRAMPISEAGFSGAAVGAAAAGLRPVVFWRNVTFSFVAFDTVINQASKLRYMFNGQRSFPVVFLATCGGGLRLGAQHSQSPYSIFAHVAGIKVLLPTTSEEAKGLLKSAIRDDSPTIVLIPTRLEQVEGAVAGPESITPIGAARTRRAGDDVTVVALGYMVEVALAAASAAAEDGISVEVIDPRTVSPLDVQAIHDSVRRTGRLVVVDEAPSMCSVASEIGVIVAEDPRTFSALRAPIRRVCGAPVPIPYSPVLEDAVLPTVGAVRDAIRTAVSR
jgi:pyruvate/2-oxoglutarate/acetoin dehydrogenase E1 component